MPSKTPPSPPPPSNAVNKRLAPFVTPSTRLAPGSSRNAKLKENLLLVPPMYRRCLITLEQMPPCMFQCCHILRRSTDCEQATILEWRWGYPHMGLHVDTRKNVLILRADIHLAFDKDAFALLPSLSMLNKIYAHAKHFHMSVDRPDPIGSVYGTATSFEYSFLPLEPMKPACILRLKDVGPLADEDTQQKVAQHTYAKHTYPFQHNTLQHLLSHVHPHFVIYDAALKLEKDLLHTYREFANSAWSAQINLVLAIHALWRGHPLAEAVGYEWDPDDADFATFPDPNAPLQDVDAGPDQPGVQRASRRRPRPAASGAAAGKPRR